MGEKDLKLDASARFNETFLIQLIFGAAQIIVPTIMMIYYMAFDFNLLFIMIMGVLLIVYSFRFYFVRINLLDQIENPGKDLHTNVSARLNETFLIQLIFGAAQIIVPTIMMIYYMAFDFNLLFIMIMGALLIVYSFRFYSVRTNLLDRIEKITK